ncbi:MAG: polyamine ABC transporter substrate-binding protein [Alphaproteobacteria bacterium]|nr:polyamine ABC transporter substrate-binding protein [Alphaproteobacteria bacterium]
MFRIIIITLIGLWSATAFAASGTLKVYNWSDYIDPTVLEEFTSETGVKVVYDTYESGEIAETKMMAKGSGYDVVVVSSEYLPRMIGAGVIKPLNKGKLPNSSNLWADIMQRMAAFDSGNRHAIPYLWGTTGIGYDENRIAERMADAPVDSWAMIFDPNVVSRFTDCGVSLPDAPEEMLSAALAYLGRDPNSIDSKDIADAQATIEAIRPHVTTIGSSQLDDLAAGEACLAIGWSGDVLSAADEAEDDINIVYSVPKEGAPIWFDLMVIPADAVNAEGAHLFIDFMMRPEVIARVSNEVYYANPNEAATEFVEAEILEDPAIYPTPEAMKGLIAIASRDAKSKRAIARRWTMVKLGN